ncbi:uncharacterized protein LOC106169244 [Lingula anatina]|uniref:Uncharacterized protein LOC106169244 n=1 Tax=Lingula anatina TaxID=7574 RepID=A0A1S3J0Y4_LINAN|nr:uncharacterized protein LOC106169244 [Lingula anatina]|eukprot:XP_013404102.1 uncharacterized protein LOC106169244 [Lingula anatina]
MPVLRTEAQILFIYLAIVGVNFSETKTVSGHVYVDNYFKLYVNGGFIADDTLFKPQTATAVSFDVGDGGENVFAIWAADNADNLTTLEYNDTQVGDGGLRMVLDDGTVTSSAWKCKTFFRGPIDLNCTSGPKPWTTCRGEHFTMPENWWTKNFTTDDTWVSATEFTDEEVGWGRAPREGEGINPRTISWGQSRFIWTSSLLYDNTVVCRYTTPATPGGGTSLGTRLSGLTYAMVFLSLLRKLF